MRADDVTNLIIAALKDGRTDRAGVLDYIRGATFEGVTKTYQFEPNGDLKVKVISIYQIENGQIRWLGTSDDLIP